VKLIVAKIVTKIIAKVKNYKFILKKRDYLKYRKLIACVYKDASVTYNSNPFSCSKKEF